MGGLHNPLAAALHEAFLMEGLGCAHPGGVLAVTAKDCDKCASRILTDLGFRAALTARLADLLSEEDPDTQQDYGDFAGLTTGRAYAETLVARLGFAS